jgi:hypothetical protein
MKTKEPFVGALVRFKRLSPGHPAFSRLGVITEVHGDLIMVHWSNKQTYALPFKNVLEIL